MAIISIDVQTQYDFSIDDLWPDGDAPDPIRKADVDALIEKEGKRRLADAWFFPDPLVSVVLLGGCDCEGEDEPHIHVEPESS